MRFGEKLRMSIEPAWADHYVRYDKLKAQLDKVDRALACALSVGLMPALQRPDEEQGQSPSELLGTFMTHDEGFFELVEADIDRVESFYRDRLGVFKAEIEIIARQLEPLSGGVLAKEKDKKPKDKAKAGKPGKEKEKEKVAEVGLSQTAVKGLREACVDIYRNIQKLRNYGIVNYSGFVKILKKYRKVAYAPRVEAIDELRREEEMLARAARRFSLQKQSSGSLLGRRGSNMSASMASMMPRAYGRSTSAGGLRGADTTPLLPVLAHSANGGGPSVPTSLSSAQSFGPSFGPLASSVDLVSLLQSQSTLAVARELSADPPANEEGPPALPDPTKPYLDLIGESAFAQFRRVDELIEELEILFAAAFCDGDLHIARSNLLVRQSREWANMRYLQRGTKLGLALALVTWVSWDVMVDTDLLVAEATRERQLMWMSSVWPVYRGTALFALGLWVYAGCLVVWQRARINYTYLFDEPALADGVAPVFDAASSFTILNCLSLLLSLKAARGFLPDSLGALNAGAYPILSALSLPATLLLPPRRGRALLRVLARVACAPFVECTFLLAFAADILTSLVKPLVDLAYTVCYVGSGEVLLELEAQGFCAHSRVLSSVLTPLILAGPTSLRLCQNLRKYTDSRPRSQHRHPSLSNALKYLCSLSVSLLGSFHKEFGHISTKRAVSHIQLAWLTLYVCSSLYAFCWDVTVDWGLGAFAKRLPSASTPVLRADFYDRTAEPDVGEALARAREQRGSTTRGFGAGRPDGARGGSGALSGMGRERRVSCGLREHLLYRSPWIYYVSILFDLIGRFVFLYTLVPKGSHLGSGSYLHSVFLAIGPFIAALEILRRGMWSLLRLENQQLGNGPDLPSTTDSIPLHFDKRKTHDESATSDEESGMSAALEVGAFVAMACGVLVFAFVTRSTHAAPGAD
mmetsp:Transcript_35717/g.88948  ORF Transcript_35717/g.88948 Transcript_35717/m.88948 type:complete len:922 (-) Transcript_35717:108-2873(-)